VLVERVEFFPIAGSISQAQRLKATIVKMRRRDGAAQRPRWRQRSRRYLKAKESRRNTYLHNPAPHPEP